MSAAPPAIRTEAEDALLVAFDAAAERLPGDKWIARQRAAAIDRFRHTGLPNRRVEEWKYTDLRALMRVAAPLASELKRPTRPPRPATIRSRASTAPCW